MIDRLKVFETELNAIQNDNIRKYTKIAIQNILPEYFFQIPASSTGKYHPEYATGDGGLVRHTKAMAKLAIDILHLEFMSTFTQEEKDLMIAACVLHDGFKSGTDQDKSAYTRADHPQLMANALINAECLRDILPAEQESFLYDVIITHMGEFNTDFKTKKEILPKPTTYQEFFVHLFDYLASRKYLDVDFGEDRYNPTNYEIGNSKIQKIIDICRDKIQAGVDRDKLLGIIATFNNGKQNPKNIQSEDIADKILEEIEKVEVES